MPWPPPASAGPYPRPLIRTPAWTAGRRPWGRRPGPRRVRRPGVRVVTARQGEPAVAGARSPALPPACDVDGQRVRNVLGVPYPPERARLLEVADALGLQER